MDVDEHSILTSSSQHCFQSSPHLHILFSDPSSPRRTTLTMQLRSFFSLAVLALTPSVIAQTPANPFNMTYIFTAHLNLGAASNPINVTGGVRVIEPILNGTVTGPILNGTINYSLATPTIINNSTIQVPTINVVGTTSDGYPFYIYETGIGSPSTQITRIVSCSALDI